MEIEIKCDLYENWSKNFSGKPDALFVVQASVNGTQTVRMTRDFNMDYYGAFNVDIRQHILFLHETLEFYYQILAEEFHENKMQER